MSSQSRNLEIALSRRDLLKGAAAVAAGGFVLSAAQGAFAQGSDKLRVGVIGCGGRGTGAAIDACNAAEGIEIHAMGDLFQDRLDGSRAQLAEKVGAAYNVADERAFTGFDSYQKVIASGVDLVILAAPPGFRPLHLRAAVEAGKHIFTEKPVCVDPTGAREVIAIADLARQKGLAIVAGTQRRHDAGYNQTMARIQDGAIGEIVGGQCYWNMGGLWVVEQTEAMSDMEWMCRNWLYFTWLSGDHIVEQHVHNIDVINWALGGPPTRAMGMGGRQVRTDPKYGNIFDHFAVEFEYPGGVRVMSMCRQTPGCADRVSERLVGTKGTADPAGRIEGANAWEFKTESPVNPYVQEHADLIASIRAGEPLNELRRVAESCLTAIMGRMSAYTGREVNWDWVLGKSQLAIVPESFEFGPMEVAPVAMPGQTELV